MPPGAWPPRPSTGASPSWSSSARSWTDSASAVVAWPPRRPPATPPTATTSCRRAGAATGFVPELLTGIDEGRLSLAGAVADLDPAEGPFLVLDIGGGSTELVAGDGPDDPDLAAVSLQMGCVRLSERFFADDPPTAAELAAARGRGRRPGRRGRWPITPASGAAHRLVGLAGTVTHARIGAPAAGRVRPRPGPPRRADGGRRRPLVPGAGGRHRGPAPGPAGHGARAPGRDRGGCPHPRRGDVPAGLRPSAWCPRRTSSTAWWRASWRSVRPTRAAPDRRGPRVSIASPTEGTGPAPRPGCRRRRAHTRRSPGR